MTPVIREKQIFVVIESIPDMIKNSNFNRKTITIKGKNPVCVNFVSEINSITASALNGALAQVVNNQNDEIHLFVSTPGGTVADGIAIYNFIRALPVQTITYNIGQVNSIGNVVYQSGQRRVASTSSSFMFHGVGVNAQPNMRLELKLLQETAQSIENDQALINDIMVKHTKLSVEDLNTMFLTMAHIRASEALERGLADEVADFCLPAGVPILPLMFQG